MNKKRGQAALEFLMTYGWAVLVVLVVIGTLAYFGILNPSFLLPEKCTLQMGLYCKDHRIDSDQGTISLKLDNGMGKGIIITRIKIADQAQTILCDVGIGPYTSKTDKNATCQTSPLDCSGCGNFTYDIMDQFYGYSQLPYDTQYDGSVIACNPHENFRTSFNDNPGWRIENTQDGVIKIYCQRMSQQEGKVKVGISLLYFYDDSSPEFIHTMEGELLAKIESVNI